MNTFEVDVNSSYGIYHFVNNPKYWWKIRGTQEIVDKEMIKFIKQNCGEKSRERYLHPRNFALHLIFLTYHGTNIPKGNRPVEEGGDPLIAFNDNLEEIENCFKYKYDHYPFFTNIEIIELWNLLGCLYTRWNAFSTDLRKFMGWEGEDDILPLMDQTSKMVLTDEQVFCYFAGQHNYEVDHPKIMTLDERKRDNEYCSRCGRSLIFSKPNEQRLCVYCLAEVNKNIKNE